MYASGTHTQDGRKRTYFEASHQIRQGMLILKRKVFAGDFPGHFKTDISMRA